MRDFNWGAAEASTRQGLREFREAFQGDVHQIVVLRAGYGLEWEAIGRILAKGGQGPDPMAFWREWERRSKERSLPGLDDPGVAREMDAVVDDWVAATAAG